MPKIEEINRLWFISLINCRLVIDRLLFSNLERSYFLANSTSRYMNAVL